MNHYINNCIKNFLLKLNLFICKFLESPIDSFSDELSDQESSIKKINNFERQFKPYFEV